MGRFISASENFFGTFDGGATDKHEDERTSRRPLQNVTYDLSCVSDGADALSVSRCGHGTLRMGGGTSGGRLLYHSGETAYQPPFFT